MIIQDQFERGPSPYWVRFAIGHADILHSPGVIRFVVDGAEKGQLSDAEIDDHRTVTRQRLPWKPPLRMTVRARMSHPTGEMLGTAGFGFWNDPFDWFGNVQVPPNALWFFYGSPKNDMAFVRNVQGHGWKAAVLNGGRVDPLTMAVGNFVFRLPGMSKLVFALAQTRIGAHERVLDAVTLTDWHEYRIDWGVREARFSVDGVEVLCAPNPPTVALGFVAWVDNNYAVMGPGRHFAFGRMSIPQEQWMELSHVGIEPLDCKRPPLTTLTFEQRRNSMQEENPRCRDHPTPEMLHAFEQFNRGEYWHQHETLELVWRAEKDESIRNFYKGILQVGVGFHHITRRNYRGVDKVLTRGIQYLRPYAPHCMGVDVQGLIEEATTVLDRVHALGPERIGEIEIAQLPRLRYET